MQAFERRVLGPKSEKMPPPVAELRRQESDEDAEARRLMALERRRERAALREQLRQETVIHHVTEDETDCPQVRRCRDPSRRRRQRNIHL